jgi:hypothetical protein
MTRYCPWFDGLTMRYAVGIADLILSLSKNEAKDVDCKTKG